MARRYRIGKPVGTSWFMRAFAPASAGMEYVLSFTTVTVVAGGASLLAAALFNNLVYVIVAHAMNKMIFGPLSSLLTAERCIRVIIAVGAGMIVVWVMGPAHVFEPRWMSELFGLAISALSM